MKQFLKIVITPSFPLAVFLIVVPFVLWLTGFALIPVSGDESIYLTGLLANVFSLRADLVTNVLSIIITLFNAFLIVQINNKYTIIRNRTFLPVLVFLLLISCWTDTHIYVLAHLTLALFALSLFVFFSMYRDTKASEQAFLGSLLIASGSLFAYPVILFIPVCWIGFMRFHSFSLRTFLGSVFGVLVPWIFYFVVRYYFQPDLLWLNEIAESFRLGWAVTELSLIRVVYLAVMLVFMLVGLVGLYSELRNDSVQVRARLSFLQLIMVFAFIFSMILVDYYYLFIPFVAISYSLLISHPFTLRASKFYGILFALFILFNFAFVILQIILNA
ncbi:MAG: hypothetical protein H6Q20_2338 [Bacteroidetes bacterium]|nr:hypothetical protein [Bacteroidota bacterium]